MARKRRDIYRERTDPNFDPSKDIDLRHMRELMSTEEISNADHNYYGIYCRNIINIMLQSYHFRGYQDDVKEDIMSEGLYDTLRARLKFDGEKYPQPTAVFNYIYRIAFRSAQHVLGVYYQMQNRMVAASRVGVGMTTADGVPFSDDLLDGAVSDWDEIAAHLRASEQPQSCP